MTPIPKPAGEKPSERKRMWRFEVMAAEDEEEDA
jgi:hypothetical protein